MRRERTARSRWSRKRKNRQKWNGVHTRHLPLLLRFKHCCVVAPYTLTGVRFLLELERSRRRSWEKTTRTSTSLSSSWGESTASGTSAGWSSGLVSTRKITLMSARALCGAGCHLVKCCSSFYHVSRDYIHSRGECRCVRPCPLIRGYFLETHFFPASG